MVLFYDNETEDKKTKTPRHPVWRWTRRLIIAAVIFAGLSAVGLVILSNLSGQNEALKKGVEAYLSEATGLNVRVETFEYMEIYPDVELDLGHIVFAKPGTGETVAAVESFNLEVSFWDLFFSRSRMKSLDLADLTLDESLAGYPVSVARAQLVHDPARFQVNGRFNDQDFSLTADLKSAEDNGVDYFVFSETVPVQAQAGDMTLTGQLDKTNGITLDIHTLSLPDTTMTGRITYKRETGTLAHNWDIDLKSGQTALDIDMAHGSERVEGEVTTSPYHISDTKHFKNLAVFIQNLLAKNTEDKVTDDPKAPRLPAAPEIDMSLNIKDVITSDGVSAGHVAFPLTLKNSVIEAGPITGRLAGGHLSGDMTLSGQADVYDLTADITWKDWTYEDLQNILTNKAVANGTAITELKLHAESDVFSDLPGQMNGEFITIGGQGNVEAGILNLWGKGLFSTMFPDGGSEMDLNMNCLIADFTIKDGIASASPVFLDTKDVTVVGTGDINLEAWTLDLTLQPENKGAALLTSATAVIVSGPLQSPSVRPSVKSLGTSLGKLFLGTLNPALFAISVVDLGIGADHPCYEYFPNAENSGEEADGKTQDTTGTETREGTQNEAQKTQPPQDDMSPVDQPGNP